MIYNNKYNTLFSPIQLNTTENYENRLYLDVSNYINLPGTPIINIKIHYISIIDYILIGYKYSYSIINLYYIDNYNVSVWRHI